MDPSFKFRDAGENAIRDWLIETMPEISGPVLVLYEDKKVPKLLQRQKFTGIVVVATTRAVLVYAEECGFILSAEDVWNSIVKRAAGANPSLAVQSVKPPQFP